jgi:hypothetical protein
LQFSTTTTIMLMVIIGLVRQYQEQREHKGVLVGLAQVNHHRLMGEEIIKGIMGINIGSNTIYQTTMLISLLTPGWARELQGVPQLISQAKVSSPVASANHHCLK